MSTITQIVNPMFSLLENASLDGSIANRIFRQYKPDVAITSSTTQIIVNVRDLKEYIHLMDSYMVVSGTFQKSAGNFAVGDRPALECGATSLFNQSRLRLNNVLIEDNFSLSHLNSFVKQLTTQSKDYNDTISQVTGFILDRNTGLATEAEYAAATVQQVGVARNADFNSGYNQRRIDATGGVGNGADITAGTYKHSYVVRLSDLFSCCNVNKVLKGITIRLELGLRPVAERMFNGTNTANCNFDVTDLDLWLSVVEPTLSVSSELEALLAGQVNIPWQYVNWKTYQSDSVTQSGATNRSYQFSIQSQKPLGAFVYAQRGNSLANDFQYNSMIFDQCAISSVQMRVNSKLYPYQSYEPGFDSTDGYYSARPYEELLKFMSKNYDLTSGALITSSEWSKLYTIFYIPFNNLPESQSYQLTLDVKSSSGLVSGTPATRNTSVTYFMTLMTAAEVNIRSDAGSVSVYAI